MNILYINTTDKAGGAEKAAYDLFIGSRNRGHQAFLAVGKKTTESPYICEINNNKYRNPWARYWRSSQEYFQDQKRLKFARLASKLANLGELKRWAEWQQGHEDFNFPGIYHLLNDFHYKLDLIHLHNLHGGYFDLQSLALISKSYPVFLTLHDEWAFTGHCACTFGCERWRIGCGQCPNLSTYPALKVDGTNYNWNLKSNIFTQSKLYVAAPSKWLLKKAQESFIRPAMLDARVIPYGIDLEIYRPSAKTDIRQELNLPLDAMILLFIANKTKNNPYKDYRTIEESVRIIADSKMSYKLLFLCIGEHAPDETIGPATIRYIGYQQDPRRIAKFYQASDVYLHAAKTESFGLVIAEAQACGIPVVATDVGGISEVVENNKSGFLVPASDSRQMALHAIALLNNEQLKKEMGNNAYIIAQRRYSLNRYLDDYINWYIEIVNNHAVT